MKVLVIAEHNNKSIKTSTFSTITAASQISDQVDVLIVGHKLDEAVGELKKSDYAKKILVIDKDGLDNPIAENLSSHILEFLKNNNDYTHILTPSSTFGKNLSPKIATKLDVQQISDIIKVFDADTFERPIYAGNALQTVKSKDNKKVISVRTANFETPEMSNSANILNTNCSVVENKMSLWVEDKIVENDRPELTSAKIVVSGGRGIGSEENFDIIEKLASKLGAAVGASRAAVDSGFAPNDWQVGQTGKVVAPELYVAVGISGAIQHLAGMKDSKVIVAINKDEEAPIFQVADFGLVGDLFNVVPELTNKI